MDIRFRSFAWSILSAVALMLCLGLAMLVMIVLFRGDDALENEEEETVQSTTCFFTGQAEQLILYHAPVSAPSQQKSSVLGHEAYPIIKQNRGYYLLQITDDITGWADSRVGAVEGNCEEMPIDETALSEFPTVCAFVSTDEVLLYSEAELINAIEVVPAGTQLVESVSSTGYYLVLGEDVSGWVAAADGQISGNCDPVRAG